MGKETAVRRIYLALSIVIIFANSISALEKTRRSKKFGMAITPNIGFVNPGFAAGLDYNIYNVLSVNHKIRVGGAEDILGASDSSNAHFEVGYLVGMWKRNRIGYLSAMAGLSIVRTTKKGKELVPPDCFLVSCTDGTYEISKSRTFGFPFQLEAVFVKHIFGAGISITGNINGDRSYGGVIFEFPIGWVPS
jgi:hypothetical protein